MGEKTLPSRLPPPTKRASPMGVRRFRVINIKNNNNIKIIFIFNCVLVKILIIVLHLIIIFLVKHLLLKIIKTLYSILYFSVMSCRECFLSLFLLGLKDVNQEVFPCSWEFIQNCRSICFSIFKQKIVKLYAVILSTYL